MFLIVSQWEAKPGKEADFERVRVKTAAAFRKQPGVEMVHSFKSGKKLIAIHGYKDEATYRKLVDDPQGTFAKISAEHGIDEFGTWISSERGEATEY